VPQSKANAKPADKADARDYGLAVFLMLLAAIGIVVTAAAFWHRDPDTALVLATPHDCRRAFDVEQCAAIVHAALDIHARTAPGFNERSTCELSFGAGQCRQLGRGAGLGDSFVPEIAVVLASRDGVDDASGLLPLYYGSRNERATAEGGRRVYYHGLAVGVLSEVKFGGADISRFVDLSGKPMTSAKVRKLRGR
jgi:uncharacterized protein YgiB involved in biofilm formation